MPAYRFYRNRRPDHIGEPPEDLKFADDAAAVAQAKKLLDGEAIEVWRVAMLLSIASIPIVWRVLFHFPPANISGPFGSGGPFVS